jgi:hypothetical protein
MEILHVFFESANGVIFSDIAEHKRKGEMNYFHSLGCIVRNLVFQLWMDICGWILPFRVSKKPNG